MLVKGAPEGSYYNVTVNHLEYSAHTIIDSISRNVRFLDVPL